MAGSGEDVSRYERQLTCVEKAERMAKDAGFTPQLVPPKILFPLLEGASFEDNDDLHTMWSALLANAASPDCAGMVRPGFIAILRQMAPDEASLLNALFDESAHLRDSLSEGQEHFSLLIMGETVNRISQGLGQNLVTCGICLDRLQAQYLIQRRFDAKFEAYMLTASCFHFLIACRPPKPRA